MARYGTCYGSTYGDPAAAVEYVNVRAVVRDANGNTAVPVSFRPRTGCGDAWFGVYGGGNLALNVLAADGVETSPISIPVPYGMTQMAICVMRLGHGNDPAYSIARIARYDETADANRARLAWSWKPRVEGAIDDGGYTSNWSLTGLLRSNTQRATQATRGELVCDLAVAAGVVTVALYNGSLLVASGSGAVGGSITLAAQNSSGISGSVDVDGSAVTTTGATVLIRWPAAMNILRGTSNPPTAVVATETYNSRDTAVWVEPANLAAGTYYYILQPVSDTDDIGDNSAVLTAVIAGSPAPVSDLAYGSGNAAATVLSFVGSTTAGATYRAYLQPIGAAVFDLENIAATVGTHAAWTAATEYSAGDIVVPTTPNGYRYECTTGGISAGSEPTWPTAVGGTANDGTAVWTCRKFEITLPAITDYPGTARALVRAVNGTVEEKNIDWLALEYDAAGDFVAARPNAPTLLVGSAVIDDGLKLTIVGTYSPALELATPTGLLLFARAPGGEYNYASPDATGTLADAGGVLSTLLAKTFASSGWFYLVARAVTAGGVASADSPEVLVFVSDENMPAPTDISVNVARG